jgi:hypothetical protein
MAADRAMGGLLVLPWHLYLPYNWNRGRAVIQPAPAYFTRPVLESTALEVGGIRLPPEDPWSRGADPPVRSGRPLESELPSLGIRYVVLLKEADWRRAQPSVAGLERVMRGADLDLYRSTVPTRVPRFGTPPIAPVVGGDAVTLGFLAICLGRLGRWRRSTRSA